MTKFNCQYDLDKWTSGLCLICTWQWPVNSKYHHVALPSWEFVSILSLNIVYDFEKHTFTFI